jgi:hypothetical protein
LACVPGPLPAEDESDEDEPVEPVDPEVAPSPLEDSLEPPDPDESDPDEPESAVEPVPDDEPAAVDEVVDLDGDRLSLR